MPGLCRGMPELAGFVATNLRRMRLNNRVTQNTNRFDLALDHIAGL